jgi:hypothetical protein
MTSKQLCACCNRLRSAALFAFTRNKRTRVETCRFCNSARAHLGSTVSSYGAFVRSPTGAEWLTQYEKKATANWKQQALKREKAEAEAATALAQYGKALAERQARAADQEACGLLAGGEMHQLYRYRDQHRRLLYVGISYSAVKRAAEHRKSAHWYWSASSIEMENFPDKRTAELAERVAIRIEKPLFNVAHIR